MSKEKCGKMPFFVMGLRMGNLRFVGQPEKCQRAVKTGQGWALQNRPL